MAETKKKKPGFWGKVGNIAKGTAKDALKIITRTDGIGDGPGQVSKKTIQERKKKREQGKMPYQKAVAKRKAAKEAANNPKKKRSTAASRMRAKNVAIHGEKAISGLEAKNKDFQKMKKGGLSKADFIKKYPNSNLAKKSRR